MNALAHHRTPAQKEDANRRMKLQRALPNRSKRQILQQVPFARAPRHNRDNAERRRYGRALKVLALPGGILGHLRDCDVEACEAREAA